jgi:hypothetical protein
VVTRWSARRISKMDYRLVRLPVELMREFDEDLLMIIDPDYFPRGIKVMRLINLHAPELFNALDKAGWEVWAVPTEAAYR